MPLSPKLYWYRGIFDDSVSYTAEFCIPSHRNAQCAHCAVLSASPIFILNKSERKKLACWSRPRFIEIRTFHHHFICYLNASCDIINAELYEEKYCHSSAFLCAVSTASWLDGVGRRKVTVGTLVLIVRTQLIFVGDTRHGINILNKNTKDGDIAPWLIWNNRSTWLFRKIWTKRKEKNSKIR